MDNESPQLFKRLVFILLGVIFAMTASGYVLFYQANKRAAQKERDYEILREKELHAAENYTELQKKFNTVTEDLSRAKKDYEEVFQHFQGCRGKQEELQVKNDECTQDIIKLKKDLIETQTKLGITPTVTLDSERDHPIKLLNPEALDSTKEPTAQGSNGQVPTETTPVQEESKMEFPAPKVEEPAPQQAAPATPASQAE